MYVTYTRIYGWSDYGGESSYQPGYRLENMMWMTLLVYDYIIPGEKMELIWIRHLQTPGNEKRQYIGSTDEPLSEKTVEGFLKNPAEYSEDRKSVV